MELVKFVTANTYLIVGIEKFGSMSKAATERSQVQSLMRKHVMADIENQPEGDARGTEDVLPSACDSNVKALAKCFRVYC